MFEIRFLFLKHHEVLKPCFGVSILVTVVKNQLPRHTTLLSHFLRTYENCFGHNIYLSSKFPCHSVNAFEGGGHKVPSTPQVQKLKKRKEGRKKQAEQGLNNVT